MTKEVGVGQAHSKIILIGEHAVVYGYPAISLPLLEVEVTCRVVPAATPWRLFEEDTLSMAVYASLEYLNIKDAKTCLSDQPIRFIKNVGFEELTMDLSAFLVIADTGVYGHTREAIQVVESKGKDALPFLHALGELTQEAEEAIKTKDAVKLGEILTKAHGNLKEIGVSSPEADALVESALEQGALGAKMSGGGLGGCIIALVANENQAQELAERLEEKGAVQTWIESL